MLLGRESGMHSFSYYRLRNFRKTSHELSASFIFQFLKKETDPEVPHMISSWKAST
jgi:hypothetical protein